MVAMMGIKFKRMLQVALEGLLVAILIASHLANCLDSPAKIQRNKQQQQHQRQQQVDYHSNDTTFKASSSNVDDLDLLPMSNFNISNSNNDENSSRSIRRQYSLDINSSNATNSNYNYHSADKIDRVRRTNSEFLHLQEARVHTNQASQQQQRHQECPSNRHIQSLLPPQYVGSPTTSQRQSAERAHCECRADLLGWHITCFAGPSPLTEITGSNGNSGNLGLTSGTGDSLQHSRISSSSSNAPMPNQLHPAFRTSQQQHHSHQLNQQVLAAASSDLSFQTIPVLFSVKYLRNNMIEIDCDQEAPNYKAAMFRGFNANEISSFTFNNCQLPNIPFSVLLHRTATATRTGVVEPSTSSSGQQQHYQHHLAPLSGSSSLTTASRLSQSLKPNRQRQPGGGQLTNLVRRRRQQPNGFDDASDTSSVASLHDSNSDSTDDQQQQPPPIEARSNEPKIQWQTSPKQQQSTGSRGAATSEPKIKSLVVNLNAVVDQRTLISLLTGLDLLEDLQLNYMQLNLTNFLNDLHIAPSSSSTVATATTTSSQQQSNDASPPTSSRTSSTSSQSTSGPSSGGSTLSVTSTSGSATPAEELIAAANATPQLRQKLPQTQTDGSTSRSTSPLSTTATQEASIVPTISGNSSDGALGGAQATTPPRLATSLGSAPTVPLTSSASSSVTGTTISTTSTTMTTTPPPTTLSSNNDNNRNSFTNLRPFKKQQQLPATITTTITTTNSDSSASQSKPIHMGSSSTKPTITGAPRGLMIAQATVIPPLATTSGASQPTTLPTVTSLPQQTVLSSVQSSVVATSANTPLASSGSPASTPSPTTTTSTSTTINTGYTNQVAPTTNTLSATTNAPSGTANPTMLGPGQRQLQAQQQTTPGIASNNRSNNNNNNNSNRISDNVAGNNLISIGTSQSHSVSYTSQSNMTSGSRPGGQAATVRPQPSGMFHLVPTIVTTTTSSESADQQSVRSTATPTSSTLMSASVSSTSSRNNQLSPTNRLHQSPSAWFAGSSAPQTTAPLAAGSRLSGPNVSGSGSGTAGSASSSPSSYQPGSSSPFNWSAINAQSAMTTISSSVGGGGLSAPVNTPPFTQQPPPSGSSAFGSRTNIGSSNPQSVTPLRTTVSNMQQPGRRQQHQTTNPNGDQSLTSATTTASTGQFVAAGGRLHHSNHQRRLHPAGATTSSTIASSGNLNQNPNQHQNGRFSASFEPGGVGGGPTNDEEFVLNGSRELPNSSADEEFGSASSAGGDGADGDLMSDSSAASPAAAIGANSQSRRKRAAVGLQEQPATTTTATQSLQFEEFELSFGELLPNLRTLKLESFIDFSSITAKSGNGNSNNNSRRRTNGQAGGGQLARFKRQFQPNDVPEKDNGDDTLSEFELTPASANGQWPGDNKRASGASGDQDTLIAEESGVHHNSVMAPAPDGGNERKSQETSGPKKQMYQDEDADHDIEPGETLWRSASRAGPPPQTGDSNSGIDSGEHDADSEGRGVRVRPPSGTGGSNSDDQLGWNSAPSEPSTQVPSGADMDSSAASGAQNDFGSDAAQMRARQYSALILNKLFSRLDKLRILQLVSNELPYWPDNVLQDSHNSLTRLYLISNNVRQLGPRSMAHLGELQMLDLSSNQLRQLAPDLLRDLVNLRKLRATHNLFRRLPLKLITRQTVSNSTSNNSGTNSPSATTRALYKLESVDFSKNKYLNQLTLDAFSSQQHQQMQNLAPITSLDLADCSLTDQFLATGTGVQTTATSGQSASAFFAALTSLVNVSLHSNKFRDLLSVASLFGKNKHLQRLDLSHNQLQRVNTNLFNKNASSLVELKLDHNQLSELPEQFLFNLRSLRRLSVAHNQIKQLSAKMFLTNQLIESIDLSHNQLLTLNTRLSGQVPFGDGANLKQLNLAHNNLSHFESDIFDISWSFYANLHTLDLSHNKFQGQIQIPIFYTSRDEMLLSLASNQIQSVSVDALVQHEQVLDRYAATPFESSSASGGSPVGELANDDEQQQPPTGRHSNRRSDGTSGAGGGGHLVPKTPTVTIRLANNPLSCDCMLEPLISYTRRVAAATNPALLATLFPSQEHANGRPAGNGAGQSRNSLDDSLPPSSRYSVVAGAHDSATSAAARHEAQLGPKHPQVLYQFKFNDLSCAKPSNLHRRPLSHISIGDLLCPVHDERLCPRQCDCHYQSAFKTVIVDCHGRKLTQVPQQLTDAANFLQFALETSFNLSSPVMAGPQAASGNPGGQNNRVTITSVDKMIIRLDNNRLTSMDRLASLFSVVIIQPPSGEQQQQQQQPNVDGGAGDQEHHSRISPSSGSERNLRFARAPQPAATRVSASDAGAVDPQSNPELLLDSEMDLNEHSYASPAAQSSARPSVLIDVDNAQQGPSVAKSKRISPVAIARKSMQAATGEQDARQRQRRQTTIPVPLSSSASNNDYLGADVESSMAGHADLEHRVGPASATHLPMSTAVLESAEEFRNKRYLHQTCELYLDHNLIETLPESFLDALDYVRASSMQPTQTPPQAALPSAMLEPPVHTKLNHLAANGPDHLMTSASGTATSMGGASSGGSGSGAGDPLGASASSLHISSSASSLASNEHFDEYQLDPPPRVQSQASPLFGRQPLAADKKAALLETINQNVRLSKLQQESTQQVPTGPRVSVSPSLVVLSLRHNNLANVSARMLQRLSKLIRSSNTKLYLGHNPYNCSDNYKSLGNDTAGSPMDKNEPLTATEARQQHQPHHQHENNVIATPMGDQLLAASDSVSGAYLVPAPEDADDLVTSASGSDSSSQASSSAGQPAPLTPTDCPVGQLKTWLTRHHAHVGDLDELYCVHMPAELADKLHLTSLASSSLASNMKNSSHTGAVSQPASDRLRARHAISGLSGSSHNKWDHDHPWASSFMSPSMMGSSGAAGSGLGAAGFKFVNTSQLRKSGVTWNADLLMASAKLIDVDLYDMCPYSGIQLLDPAAAGYLSATHQQALISIAIVFILISVCLLLMLIYFGDTQTILAFIYIHLNPIYNCLHLNESHLDGEKLYDAFVSYSSADRDIVMELIERLEQANNFGDTNDKVLTKGTNLDKSRDTLVTEADLRPNVAGGGAVVGLGTLQRRSTSTLAAGGGVTASSFQDLTTMSRSTSRAMLTGDETGAAPLDFLSSPRHNRSAINNESAHSNSTLALDRSSSDLLNGTGTGTGAGAGQRSGGNQPYRLCIHERDWLPGHLISWNIVNSVQNSRRTILILSKEFIKSVWFQVEFHTAYYQMLEDKIDRLIVIVRGELPPRHELDKNLAFLLTTKTYLTWGEKWFWERLHYALPHRTGPPMATLKSNYRGDNLYSKNKKKKQKQEQGQQQRPKEHANRYKKTAPVGDNQAFRSNGGDFLGHSTENQSQQKPLVMSSIGRDCSNLLLPQADHNTKANRLSGGPNGGSSSSTSSTSGRSTGGGLGGSSAGQTAGQQNGGNRSASASSFLSGSSSTNQLFKPDPSHQIDHVQMMTTSNDLLSSPMASKTSTGNTTRLNIEGGGGGYGMRSSSPLATDSGRVTADRLSSSQMSIGQTTTSGGVTSILLEGAGATSGSMGQQAANSRLRAKKQEKLQSFVDKEISNHFNLSEL